MNEKFYTYKGYPLVRKGSELYYGYMSDPYVINLKVLSKKNAGETEISDKIIVTQMATDFTLDPQKICIKNMTCEGGLYEALDTARLWLEKALAAK